MHIIRIIAKHTCHPKKCRKSFKKWALKYGTISTSPNFTFFRDVTWKSEPNCLAIKTPILSYRSLEYPLFLTFWQLKRLGFVQHFYWNSIIVKITHFKNWSWSWERCATWPFLWNNNGICIWLTDLIPGTSLDNIQRFPAEVGKTLLELHIQWFPAEVGKPCGSESAFTTWQLHILDI